MTTLRSGMNFMQMIGALMHSPVKLSLTWATIPENQELGLDPIIHHTLSQGELEQFLKGVRSHNSEFVAFLLHQYARTVEISRAKAAHQQKQVTSGEIEPDEDLQQYD